MSSWIARRLARWSLPGDVELTATVIDTVARLSRGRHFESDTDVTAWLERLAQQVREHPDHPTPSEDA